MAEKITIRETVRIKLEESSDLSTGNSTAGFCRESPASWECAHLCYVESQKT